MTWFLINYLRKAVAYLRNLFYTRISRKQFDKVIMRKVQGQMVIVQVFSRCVESFKGRQNKVCERILCQCYTSKAIATTFLTLVLKIENPHELVEFRPICLVACLQIVISKIILLPINAVFNQIIIKMVGGYFTNNIGGRSNLNEIFPSRIIGYMSKDQILNMTRVIRYRHEGKKVTVHQNIIKKTLSKSHDIFVI